MTIHTNSLRKKILMSGHNKGLGREISKPSKEYLRNARYLEHLQFKHLLGTTYQPLVD